MIEGLDWQGVFFCSILALIALFALVYITATSGGDDGE